MNGNDIETPVSHTGKIKYILLFVWLILLIAVWTQGIKIGYLFLGTIFIVAVTKFRISPKAKALITVFILLVLVVSILFPKNVRICGLVEEGVGCKTCSCIGIPWSSEKSPPPLVCIGKSYNCSDPAY